MKTKFMNYLQDVTDRIENTELTKVRGFYMRYFSTRWILRQIQGAIRSDCMQCDICSV